jgi:hypothetical protein
MVMVMVESEVEEEVTQEGRREQTCPPHEQMMKSERGRGDKREVKKCDGLLLRVLVSSFPLAREPTLIFLLWKITTRDDSRVQQLLAPSSSSGFTD